MQILIDTDVFCTLGMGGLLHDGTRLLGAKVADCARLAALPHMLRRGRLPEHLGEQACLDLLPLAEQMPIIPDPPTAWLERLVLVHEIDPGEAQLFAVAADRGLVVMTGDNRALTALKRVEGFPEALSGRIVSSVAILFALCDDLGPEEVRGRLEPTMALDKTIRICFSEGNPDPQAGLASYYRSLVAELSPLTLWSPRPGGGL